ncbi:MAG: hypothetical protein EUB_02393 [Eubacterium sp.]|uniref:lipopolysaccharide biosynthesis protein n=1 Tax=Eubacterium sp. TaxID=142586 RepID=UPI003039D3E8
MYTRGKNAMLNIVAGFAAQILIILIAFIGRKVFVHFLSLDYLGINGLYSNILSVLALAELGLGNVTQFFLYKPVAEKKEAEITYLVKYFKHLYRIIACTILALGLAFIPFLRYVVNSDLSNPELIAYYVIFLLNSVVSYLSAHSVALLAANQDNRLQKYVLLGTNFAAQGLQIGCLFIWRNYYIYVTITLLLTLVNVVVINRICSIRYPYLKNKTNVVPDGFDRQFILDNVKSTFVYKIGATIVNNTDNILISIIVSTAAVGLYSNYFLVVSSVQTFIAIITTALISGVGNLSADGNKKRMYEVFNVMLLIYQFIAVFGAIGFYFLFDDLMTIWLGSEYMLGKFTVFAIVLNFYSSNAISPIWMYRESNGLFKKVKYLFLVTAGVNVVLSVLFGELWGMAGILLATSIARVLTQVWYEPRILFKEVFGISSKYYWRKQAKLIILSSICFIICWRFNGYLPHSAIFMVIKAILFLIVCMIVFTVGMIGTTEMHELKYRVNELLDRFRRS